MTFGRMNLYCAAVAITTGVGTMSVAAAAPRAKATNAELAQYSQRNSVPLRSLSPRRRLLGTFSVALAAAPFAPSHPLFYGAAVASGALLDFGRHLMNTNWGTRRK